MNEEKKIKEYINKQAEIAPQKEEEKKERVERRRKKREYLENGARAQFLDPEYLKQMDKINEDLNAAIKTAHADKKRKKSSEDDQSDEEADGAKASTSAAASKLAQDSKACSSAQAAEPAHGKSSTAAAKPIAKNLKGWLGVDAEISSSDEEEEPVVTKSELGFFCSNLDSHSFVSLSF